MKKITLILLASITFFGSFAQFNKTTSAKKIANHTAVSVTYATWNPADKSSYATLSNGNLTVSFGRDDLDGCRSTIGKTDGATAYVEFTCTRNGGTWPYYHIGGVSGSAENLEGNTIGESDGFNVGTGSDIYVNNSLNFNLSTGAITDGDIIGINYNFSGTGTAKVYVNATLAATVTGWFISGHTYYCGTSQWHAAACCPTGTTTANFGATTFTYPGHAEGDLGWFN